MSSDDNTLERTRRQGVDSVLIRKVNALYQDGYHEPETNKQQLAYPIAPLKPPSGSLVAPYNSTALTDGCNLMEQSHVYLLAAPAGGYNSTALPCGQNLAAPFDTHPRLAGGVGDVALNRPDMTAPSDIYPSTLGGTYNASASTLASRDYYIPRPDTGDNSDSTGGSDVSSDNTYHMALPVRGGQGKGHNDVYHLPVPVKHCEETSVKPERCLSAFILLSCSLRL